MNPITDTILPAQGYLNWDDEENYLPKGDTRYRMNVEIRKGNQLALVNKKGTELITNSSLPAGTNTIIGWGEWLEEDVLILMIHNSNSDHCIQKLDLKTNTFSFLKEDEPLLNFSITYPIYDVKVIGSGSNAEVVWTDNYNGIGKMLLNIGATTTIDESQVRLAKAQPLFKIQVALDSNTTLKSNNIWGHQYQFCCRFVYDTGEVSAWDGFSDVVFNFENEFLGLGFSANVSLNNEIDLSWSETTIPNAATDIEIAVRKTDKDSGVWENWVLYDTLAYSPGVNSYTYRGDKVTQTVDQDEFNIPYYDIPLKAKSLEVISGNRVMLGQPTKGYDNIDINVTLSHIYYPEDFVSYTRFFSDIVNIANSANDDIDIKKSGESYHKLTIGNGTTEEYYSLTSDLNYSTASDVTDFFVSLINAGTSFSIVASNSSGDLNIANTEGVDIGVCYTQVSLGEVSLSLKEGGMHYFGLLYFDSVGRSGRVQVSDDTRIYISFCTERGFNWVSSSIDYQAGNKILNGIKYEINHNPPSWATSYAWCYGGNNIQDYFTVSCVIEPYTDDLTTDISRDGDKIVIDLPKMIARYDEARQIKTFDPVQGDRVRIIGGTAESFSPVPRARREYLDFEILEVDGDGKIYIQNWDFAETASDLNDTGASTRYNFEFYSIKKDFDNENLYYNVIGDIIPITNGYHEATADTNFGTYNQEYLSGAAFTPVSAQTQTVSLPAIGSIKFGNTYYRISYDYDYVNDVYPFSEFSIKECSNISDYFLADQITNGRLDYVDKKASQQAYEAITWGGKKSEGELNFNELNNFHTIDSDGNVIENIEYLDSKHGEISNLIEVGYTLNVFQKSKVTSFYIERNVVTLADGTQEIYASGNVLSLPFPMGENIGTGLQMGAIKDEGDIIFLDFNKKRVYRKSVNGISCISNRDRDGDIDAKMQRWFQDTIDEGMADGTYTFDQNDFVLSNDTFNGVYLITFNFNGDYSKTIAFDKKANRWCGFYSFKPGFYMFMKGYKMYAVSGGSTYMHDSDSVNRNYFYGAQYSSEVWVYSNEYPELKKRFNAVEIYSNKKWSLNTDESIVLSPDGEDFQDDRTLITYNPYQVSSIPDKNWRYMEGMLRAVFLRDSKSTSSSNSVVDLYNGDPLRGKYAILKLTNEDTVHVVLKSVKVFSRSSD